MAKILKSILIAFFLIHSFVLFAQHNAVGQIKFIEEKAQLTSVRQATSHLMFSTFDVVFQELNLEVDPSVYYITGEVDIHYLAKENIDSLYINLSDSLTVDSVKKANAHLPFQHQGGIIRIDIDNLLENSVDALTVFYQGEPDTSQYAFFLAVQDSINYMPVLATLSEPYGSKDWWPCKDNLSDKIDSIDINITVPLGNQAVSQGLLETIDTLGAEVTYRWKHRYPIVPYLVSLAVSNYYEHHSYLYLQDGDSVLFMNYLYHNNLSQKLNHVDRTQNYFNVFDSLFIPYPFKAEKYGHAEFSVGGGMEHQTISSMGIFDFEIVSHELAHQWFGDYVTCASWEDLWLNEGYATYCTGLSYEFIHPDTWWPIWKQLSVAHVTNDSLGTVFPQDTLDVDALFDGRLTYRKASSVLNMIRWLIGDANFFQATRNYLQDENLAFGFAETPDLISYFETEADTSFDAFMTDWYYGEGYPIYNIEWSQDDDQHFYVRISQSDAADNDRFFALDVPIRLIGQNDTLDLRLRNLYNHQFYGRDPGFLVDTVIFDPEYWIISKHSTVVLSQEEIQTEASIRLYPNPAKLHLYIDIDTPNQIEELTITSAIGEIFEIQRNKNIIDISELKEGAYVLSFYLDNQIYRKKFIKH